MTRPVDLLAAVSFGFVAAVLGVDRGHDLTVIVLHALLANGVYRIGFMWEEEH